MEGMRLVAKAGGSNLLAPLILTPDSLSFRVFQQSQSTVVNDCQQHLMANKSPAMKSVIFMPLKTGSVGLVTLASDEPNYFTSEKTRHFTALANGISPLLENAELSQQMISELERRHKTEEALRESESRFSALAENTFDVMWELDASGVYTFCSSNINEVTGYEAREVIGK
jgi:PAS domain-containing protein